MFPNDSIHQIAANGPPRRAVLAGRRPGHGYSTTRMAGGAASRSALALASILIVLALRPLPAASLDDYTFVHPHGPAEWAAGGDFNGDGLIDSVIVDRVTGAYRVAYQAPDGEPAWTQPRASGIADVTGFSVGYLFNTVSQGLAFTAESANRVNVVAADDPSHGGLPATFFINAVGPNQVVAADVGGAGNTPLHDLVVASVWNTPAYRATTVRNNDGSTFVPLQEDVLAQRWDRGNRVIFRDGRPAVMAVLARGNTDALRLVSHALGPQETFLEFGPLPSGVDYVAGRFGANPLAKFLVYRPGQSNFTAYAVAEPIPGTFQPGPTNQFALARAIRTLVSLPAAAGNPARLLAVWDDGQGAAAFEFDGLNLPAVLQEFVPPAGQQILGATPSGNGAFAFGVSPVNSPRTTRSLRYSFDAGAGMFVLTHDNVLPSVTDLSARANVLQFQFEPFVVPNPRLLHRANAGDWSSLFSLAGGPPQIGVTSETYADSSRGLDDPTPLNLGPGHPQAQFGLANQYNEAVSIFSLSAASGPSVVGVSALPAGGLHSRSVAVQFQTDAPGFQVLYRQNTLGPWLTYAGKPVQIFTNTTLQYRARALLGQAQTAVKSETYMFRQNAGTLDSDSDGVPDYVEIANGLDPVRSGSDGDGDGVSDLEELLKGTSPSNAASKPPTSGYEQHTSVDWILTPRPLDGTTGAETFARGGPRVRVFDGSGSLLAAATVGHPINVSAVASNVLVDPAHPLLVAATDPHFDIVTPSTDARLGRELVAILPSPTLPPIVVPDVYGSAGGALNAEAQNWVAAAQSAYGVATNEVRSQTLSIAQTTAAALLEARLNIALTVASPTRSNLTLFPFRPADAGRQTLDDNARDLLAHSAAERPAYDLRQMHYSIEALVLQSPTPQVQALLNLAREIYRVSSASNNAAPGLYRSPLDVLRDFVRDGNIPPDYVAAGTFPPALLANATAGVHSVLNQLGSRPVTNLTLRLRPDTVGGICTTLETADLASTPVNLFAAGGGAFDFPDTFQLVPGAVVQIVGRPDVISTTCAGLNVEVLAISLATIPARSDGDADGNLLIDTWEMALLGGIGADPLGDADGDGYSNIQEMWEGSDPSDRRGTPSAPIATLTLPTLHIGEIPDDAGGGGAGGGGPKGTGKTMAAEWLFSSAYADRVEFLIQATADLSQPPTTRAITPIHLGGGLYRAILPNSGGAQFFKVRLQLKP